MHECERIPGLSDCQHADEYQKTGTDMVDISMQYKTANILDEMRVVLEETDVVFGVKSTIDNEDIELLRVAHWQKDTMGTR